MTNIGLKAFSEACENFKLFSKIVHPATKHCTSLITGSKNLELNFVYDLDWNNMDGLSEDLILLTNMQYPHHIVCEEISKDQNIFFENHHYSFVGSAQAKTCSLVDFSYIPSESIEINTVTTPQMLKDWREIAAKNFGYALGDDEGLFGNFLATGTHHDAIKLFIATLEGKPVGQSMLVLGSEITSNMWASVLPEYRRQGVLTEMISYRNALAKSKGYNSNVVQCLPESESVYDRLGYQNAEKIALLVPKS